jgi:hypothetical protein
MEDDEWLTFEVEEYQLRANQAFPSSSSSPSSWEYSYSFPWESDIVVTLRALKSPLSHYEGLCLKSFLWRESQVPSGKFASLSLT